MNEESSHEAYDTVKDARGARAAFRGAHGRRVRHTIMQA